MWCKQVGIRHKTQSTWTAYRLSTGCRRRGRRQPSPHEPAWESGDTKVGGYQRDRSRRVPGRGGGGSSLTRRRLCPARAGASCRSLPALSPRLLPGRWIYSVTKSFQGVGLKDENDAGWRTHLGVREPTCHSGIRENFCNNKKRFDHNFFFLSTVILGWHCDYLCVIHHQSVPLSEYLWPDDECTSMNLGRFSSRTLLSCRTASL